MILDEYVEVKLSAPNIKRYRNLGYDLPMHYDSKGRYSVVRNSTILVKLEDLPTGSHALLNAKCDVCGEIKKIEYKVYNKNFEKCRIYTCFPCSTFKKDKTCIEKYGTTIPMRCDEVKNKVKETNIRRYGVESPLKNKDIKKKMDKTIYDKYGVDNISQLDSIQEKVRNTNLIKYGNENYLETDDFREKSLNTYEQKYGNGICHNMQIPKIRRLAHETMYKNGNCAVSKQQLYLNLLYNTKLNYPFMSYNFDMYDDTNRIDIEYDGSGHRLSVILNKTTESKFNKKESVRDIFTKLEKIKIVRIISRKDKLPSDEVLDNMMKISKELFNSGSDKRCTLIKWDVDNGYYITSRSDKKFDFDFGKLRRIS